ncbi:MAG TPA: hypothetical protein VGO52_01450 [Hyphomonadaceae bacterium]|jgi:hypothetical protein|nr:hypothetical protein [Hyphomonadaceae bacterium]
MLKRSLIALALLAAACQPQQTPAPETKPADPAPEQAAVPAQLAADEIPAPAGEITVTSVAAGAKVTSPLTVEGSVINNWMFEGSFPVEIAANGESIAVRPGEQQAPDNWTNVGPVKFKAALEFTVTKETPAVLILKEDMPKPKSADSDEPGPARTLRIPVVLVPAS